MAEFSPEVISSAGVEHLRWAMTPGIGPILFGRILEHFESAQAALGASAAQLQGVEGIDLMAVEIARARDAADVTSEVEQAARHGTRILCRDDEEYPAGLRHIPDPPICLYIRGHLEREDAIAVAVVGSRRCSIYGREQARRFGYQLASRGVTVVSGLARGVDSESHQGALSACGRTLAVLGNGLAGIYPPEHRELADCIVQHGALLSELPMTASPQKENFLPRNRIIAGLSLGVLVVEAAYRSGALSTAARASEYNREVFAIPGRVDSDFSAGTNALIRDQHAKLVTCADDVLDEMGEVGTALSPAATTQGCAPGDEQPVRKVSLSEAERRVLERLDLEEKSIEAIAAAAGESAARVAATLITLQLKGLVKQLPGNLFVRVRTS